MPLLEPVVQFDPLTRLWPALPVRQIRVWLSICILSAIWFAAAVLLVRSLAGALIQPLSSVTLIALGLLAVAAIQAARWMLRGVSLRRRPYLDYALRTGLLMFALALSLPG